MRVPFYTILILNVIILITVPETGASPRWRWSDKSKHKHWGRDRSKTNPICSSGQCVLAWKCPEWGVLEESTGSCTYWTNGPWVCCDLTDDKYNRRTNEIPSTPHSNQAATDTWYATESYGRDIEKRHESTPAPWNRNARAKPTPVSSIGDILRNGPYTWKPPHNPTKVPLTGIRKTTEDLYKRTTPVPPYTRGRTSSDPRIVFPTEAIGWTRKVTKHPAFNTQTPKMVTTQGYRPTTSPWSRSTSTKAAWKPSSRQPTRSWVGDSEGRRKSTTTTPYPNRPYTSSRAPDKPILSRTTVRTTRRNRLTTPLPNVNTYMCGIRDTRPSTNRRVRSYNSGYSMPADVMHSDSVNMKHRQPYERIVGGEEAEPYSWPWVAALYKVASSGGHRFLSAGSLINGHFVLTAAHVFTPDDLRTASYVVMLGTHDAQNSVAEYLVSSVVQHPEYEHRYYYHDIALLRLSRPVLFNDYVMPVCLPSPDAPLLRDRDLEGKNVTVMGWGDESFGGKSSRVLKEATFPIVSRSTCNASYVRVASNRFPRGITEEMLCAGDPNGGKDACQGDSGGPLTSMVRGRYTQVGIVSFGYQCGDKEFPGVYTKVAPYLSWIAENTRNIDDYGHDYHHDYEYRG